jgi:hypothetical protein
LLTEDGEMHLPEALPFWDYQMDLQLRRTVRLDPRRAKASAGLPNHARLTLAAIWTSTGSGLRGPGEKIIVEGLDPIEVDLNVHLSGSDLGGVLRLDTALVLAERCVETDPLAPRRAGSVLWQDEQFLRLQGDAPQFPMAVVDFSKTSFPDNAPWHLQISNNLHAATMGSMLLLINEKNKIAATAFENAAKARPIDRVVLSAVYADAARLMLEHALRQEEFDETASFPEDSLGATLLSLFHQLFPGSTVNDVRFRLNRSPALFASDLQAAVKLFAEA